MDQFRSAWCKYNGVCKAFNAKTQDQQGKLVPAEITVYADRSFTFITKTPPTSSLILEAVKLKRVL